MSGLRTDLEMVELFPGYGKIFERVFDVWYCEIGSKEKISQPEFKDKAILNFYDGICGDLVRFKDKNLKLESLSKTQGYMELLSAVDNKERKRWYFGLKKTRANLYLYSSKHKLLMTNNFLTTPISKIINENTFNGIFLEKQLEEFEISSTDFQNAMG